MLGRPSCREQDDDTRPSSEYVEDYEKEKGKGVSREQTWSFNGARNAARNLWETPSLREAG